MKPDQWLCSVLWLSSTMLWRQWQETHPPHKNFCHLSQRFASRTTGERTSMWVLSNRDLPLWPSGQRTWPPCAVERGALSGWGLRLSPGASAYQTIISNNSYAHDKQGVNPGHVRGFDGDLYKMWPLLMPWLAAPRCQPHWRESRSRQLWLSPLTRRWRSASPGLARQ